MSIDYAKRRRIMQRSMKLGHCICDPKRPCPCDIFKDQGLCPCAGERPKPKPMDNVKLTELVHNAGCASKIAPGDLEACLGRLPEVDDPNVLLGMPTGDDAGVYRLDGNTCIVQTIDVMTPCVDDPYTFGRICAANCLSDIYAMGGKPLTAVSVLGFPSETHDGQIMYHMMKGAMDVLNEAGVALIGGHSIKDKEIKLGFAITGSIDEDHVARHDTAKLGDVLVLTKPLGIGVLNFCRQIGRKINDKQIDESMAMLNKDAADAMNEVGAHACTDVTGFGLFGHLVSMVRHSEVTAHIFADKLPAFEGARQALEEGVIPGAIERNSEYVAEDISFSESLSEADRYLGFDSQTSGGLLITVAEDRINMLCDALSKRNVDHWIIGKITEESAGKIVVTNADESAEAAPLEEIIDTPGSGKKTDKPADDQNTQPVPSTSLGAFAALMKSTGQAGKIDEKTKELINFSLVVMGRCEPCFAAHYKKAKAMGISDAELEEAAWCASAMGGAVVRMFYLDQLHKVKAGKSNDQEPYDSQAEDRPCC